MYHSSNQPDAHRYTWIIAHDDYYNENALIREDTQSLLFPYSGIWYNFENERGEK